MLFVIVVYYEISSDKAWGNRDLSEIIIKKFVVKQNDNNQVEEN
jgi:hypothetical protein